MDRETKRNRLTRRALVAGAATGAIAAATDNASAQRCPDVPPGLTKGPLVWMNLDQSELDDAYDNNVYAFNYKTIEQRRALNNEIPPGLLAKPAPVSYGPTEIEKLDIYKTRRPNAPTMSFIHGGSWRSGRSSQFTLYAEPYVRAGANFVVLDFTNVRETDGNLFPMVEQCRRAIGWVYRNAASFGGDANALYMCSRSSGSHLAGCLLITQWQKEGLPLDILKGAVLGSGMYDLKAVRLSKRSGFVKFTDEMESELSAIRHIDRIHTPVVIAHGTLETPEFQRQSRVFAEALQAAGKPAQLIVAMGYNH